MFYEIFKLKNTPFDFKCFIYKKSFMFFQFDLKKYEAVACNNQLLNRLKILPAYFEHTFYLALSESEAYLPCRTPRWWPEGSYEIRSVHPSILSSVKAFSWNCIISFFINFGMVLETLMKLCVTELDFAEKFVLPPKLRK